MSGLPAHAEPVAQAGPTLRDIHLPPEPSWWPPAPGWWMLGAVLLLLACVAFWFGWRQRRHKAQCRRLLGQVDRLAQKYPAPADLPLLAAELHQLLRRVARQHDAGAAHHAGDAWQRSLARVAVDGAVLEQLRQLEQAVFRPTPALDRQAAMAAVRQWLQQSLKQAKWKPRLPEQDDA